MKIAVEGCCHGELDKIYETIAFIEEKEKYKVDLLLICGDFQAVRNPSDFHALAVPPKFRKMNTFYKYYSGEAKAPVLTVLIGGNHEASNYMQELPYGGWLAENIYYLGYAGVVQFGGLRIGGLSGIFKGRDFNKGHFEHPPYNEDTKRSCYHVRSLDVFRLKQIQKPVDIMLSHDWPQNIYHHGNTRRLLQKKKFFQQEVEAGTLGSAPAEQLLHHLKPSYWFSAHLHVKFAARVAHDVAEEDPRKDTKFLALDKCLPRRKFLQIIDFPDQEDKSLELELDPEWLCILRSTNHLMNLGRGAQYMPGPGCSERYDFSTTDEELSDIRETFGSTFSVPDNFVRTAEAHSAEDEIPRNPPQPQICINPQTTLICQMLELTDPFSVFSGKNDSTSLSLPHGIDSNDSLLDSDDEGIQNDSDLMDTTMESSVNTTLNPDEISLDGIDEDSSPSPPHDSRSHLVLPPPTSDESELSISLDSDGSLKRSLNEEPAQGEEGEGVTEEEESAPTPSTSGKKFRRRNQSLYTDDNDDE
ncbi:hypothetical protein CAPTEDRAFT_170958 [Capitella teleta]|uniref:Lariat debranching enzyme C-terminal domain-containing protein n=1 Tax=Capitella teleta TaxID=283909 RepID=R7U1B4_CAPTE|nr:hypothetical protein CAPTEDRAFT_170958 [Capitella teleta]|eukprot:ELT97436.1 hypothetical protein CAPTEDRAFT_170958 [Capitella teleta]